MKGKCLPFLILPILFLGFLLVSSIGTSASVNPDHKIDICHASSSDSNPYGPKKIEVDKNATAGGHSGHTGPVWYKGIVGDWGDIIPPYTYSEWEKIGSHEECPTSNSAYGNWWFGKDCQKWIGNQWKYAYEITVDDYGWKDYPFNGLNWTTEGQAIWNNNCQIPYVTCSSTVRSFTEWSEWVDDPIDETLEFRERQASAVDSQDPKIVCAGPITQKETRYNECSRTVRSFTEWSEWMIDNEDETKEIRTREGYAVDSQNSEVICAGPVVLKEVREREIEYKDCSYTLEIYGEWSDWKVDPSDSTREYRERIVNTVDSKDSELICEEPEIEKEYRNVVQDDEPEVEGITDEVEEVKGTTTVVMAETGSSDNILVYIVQTILMLSTLISGTLFVKKYII